MNQTALDAFADLIGYVAMIIALVTVAGIVMGICALLKVRFCNQCCGGCWPKFWIVLTFVGYIAIIIVFFLVGSALLVVKSGFNAEFVNEQCVRAQNR